jgi:hypothetical protein
VVLGGTLQAPRLTLESDAPPPISQSDLLSYLAFGRSSSSLLEFNVSGSGVSGGGSASGNLASQTAAIASRQLASVALGVAVDEIEGDASRSLGADFFNITPADLPTEANANTVSTFFQGTELELGKYIGPGTFLAAQGTLSGTPGFRVQHRAPKGFIYEVSVGPRYLVQKPTIASQDIKEVRSKGLFLIREWKF